MPYATPEDMRARYGEAALVQLSDGQAWDAPTIANVTVKLADATALAEGYVAKFLGPLESVPPLLVRIVCEIAYADLFRSPTEEATARKKDALAQLRDISKGLIKLDQGRADLPARSGAIILPDRERTFSRDSLEGF